MTSKNLTTNSLEEIPQDNEYKLFFERISEIIEPLMAMTQVAVKQTKPVVDWIIRTKSQDTHHIESLLDRLLDYSLHYIPMRGSSFSKNCFAIIIQPIHRQLPHILMLTVK